MLQSWGLRRRRGHRSDPGDGGVSGSGSGVNADSRWRGDSRTGSGRAHFRAHVRTHVPARHLSC